MIAAALFVGFPVYVLVNLALRPTSDTSSPIAPTASPTLDNFTQAWQQGALGGALANSVLVTVCSVAVVLAVSSLAAYPLARVTARWSRGAYLLVLLGLVLPFQLASLPLYQTMRDLGLLGTPWALVLFYSGLQVPFTVFLYTGFLRALPRDFEDAALIDGCTPLQSFRYVVLPMLKPVTVTALVLNAVAVWNDFFTVWQMTGDATIVRDNWPAMVRYLDWIRQETGDTYAGQGSLTGDWLAPQKTSAQLMSDVYYGYVARLMAQMALAIGRPSEGEAYKELFGRIRQAFITKYLGTEGGRVTVKSSLGDASPTEPGADPNQKTEDNSQTALLWVLKLGFYETEAQRRTLVGLLADNIGNDAAYKAAHPNSSRVRYAENTLSVGFLGVNVLAPVLSDEGRTDLAYKLLHQDALPSWLFSVKNGATTVWERWNSYSQDDGFGPVSMNSFNHYAYGAIMEWMYAYMAGIARDPDHPGFKRFLLQPHIDPTGRITQVSSTYESPYGEIRSEWTVDDAGRTLAYEAAVPPNSEATLHLPSASADSVREGRTPLSRVDGVRFLDHTDGVSSYRLPSGRYRMTAHLR
ncbi:alpha-L-rhamnosidase C-terminal domain-containing protein [Streptomyces acidicola]|uniref:alpha-L-rhamnosidase-related protein n=1 Tax=Streptomyces acidicola TaxID=2596892 RepID=UPI0037B0B20B